MSIDLLADVDGRHELEEVSVEFAWNGQWSDDADEMQRHLVVQQVPRR
jgi:hypothetical protein